MSSRVGQLFGPGGARGVALLFVRLARAEVNFSSWVSRDNHP
jgi:hypothetical protein